MLHMYMAVARRYSLTSTVERYALAYIRIEWYRCLGEVEDMEYYVLRCGSLVREKDTVEK